MVPQRTVHVDHVHMYMHNMKRQKAIYLENITCSELGKQNLTAFLHPAHTKNRQLRRLVSYVPYMIILCMSSFFLVIPTGLGH